jgi:hypothetical protein
MHLVKIPNTNFVRDIDSMALINQDNSGLQDYMNKRKVLAFQKDEINKVKSEISELKQDVNELKSLILQLMDKS